MHVSSRETININLCGFQIPAKVQILTCWSEIVNILQNRMQSNHQFHTGRAHITDRSRDETPRLQFSSV